MTNNKILVIGDLILDQYGYGKYTKFSAEAPVPVLELEKTEYRLGGAANVALNLQQLGANYQYITVIGEDENYSTAIKLLNELETITIIAKTSNTIKVRIISGSQQVMRIDSDNKILLSDNKVGEYLSTVCRSLNSGEFSILIISDYNKNLLTHKMIQKIVECAVYNNVKVLVDTKKKDIECFDRAYLITPNIEEHFKMTMSWGYDAQYDYIKNWLITDGANGMVLNPGDIRIPAIPVKNADVSGAGDTVLATIAAELAEGVELLQSCRTAAVAAYVVVSKEGTSTCSRKEIEQALNRGICKHYTLPDLIYQVNLWKDQEYNINIANGCFDFLHEGHLHLLKEAKTLSIYKGRPTKLVVALNSDLSVRELKGSNRPISLNRKEAVAAIPYVDAVIEFDNEKDLKNIMSSIYPNALVKGEEYIGKPLTGREYCNKVFFVFRKEDISTTKICQT